MDQTSKYYFSFMIAMLLIIGLGIYMDYLYKMEKLRLTEKGVLIALPEKV